MKRPFWVLVFLFFLLVPLIIACPRAWAVYSWDKRQTRLEGVSYSEMCEWQSRYGGGGYYGYGMGGYYGPRPGLPYGIPGIAVPCKKGGPPALDAP
jgi:hypothetical protein